MDPIASINGREALLDLVRNLQEFLHTLLSPAVFSQHKEQVLVLDLGDAGRTRPALAMLRGVLGGAHPSSSTSAGGSGDASYKPPQGTTTLLLPVFQNSLSDLATLAKPSI